MRSDQSAFCAFHEFLVEFQTNALNEWWYVITTWRLGMRATKIVLFYFSYRVTTYSTLEYTMIYEGNKLVHKSTILTVK